MINAIEKAGLPLIQECYLPWNNLLGPWFIKLGIIPRHKRMLEDIKKVRGFFAKRVEEKKQQRKEGKAGKKGRTNLLDLLLDNQEKPDEEDSFSTDEIIDEFLTFYIAGTDTISHLLTLCAYNLTQYPEAYGKALDESLKTIKDSAGLLSFDDIEKMPYILGILRETLRMTNPAFACFPRKALQDHYLGDLHIKKGTLILFHTNNNCYKSQYFENPNKFDPERWFDENKDRQHWKQEPYSYIPFSSGPRNCIGQHFALLQGRIILGMFLKRFEFKLPENYKMLLTSRFLYEPKYPLVLNLKVRK